MPHLTDKLKREGKRLMQHAELAVAGGVEAVEADNRARHQANAEKEVAQRAQAQAEEAKRQAEEAKRKAEADARLAAAEAETARAQAQAAEMQRQVEVERAQQRAAQEAAARAAQEQVLRGQIDALRVQLLALTNQGSPGQPAAAVCMVSSQGMAAASGVLLQPPAYSAAMAMPAPSPLSDASAVGQGSANGSPPLSAFQNHLTL